MAQIMNIPRKDWCMTCMCCRIPTGDSSEGWHTISPVPSLVACTAGGDGCVVSVWF